MTEETPQTHPEPEASQEPNKEFRENEKENEPDWTESNFESLKKVVEEFGQFASELRAEDLKLAYDQISLLIDSQLSQLPKATSLEGIRLRLQKKRLDNFASKLLLDNATSDASGPEAAEHKKKDSQQLGESSETQNVDEIPPENTTQEKKSPEAVDYSTSLQKEIYELNRQIRDVLLSNEYNYESRIGELQKLYSELLAKYKDIENRVSELSIFDERLSKSLELSFDFLNHLNDKILYLKTIWKDMAEDRVSRFGETEWPPRFVKKIASLVSEQRIDSLENYLNEIEVVPENFAFFSKDKFAELSRTFFGVKKELDGIKQENALRKLQILDEQGFIYSGVEPEEAASRRLHIENLIQGVRKLERIVNEMRFYHWLQSIQGSDHLDPNKNGTVANIIKTLENKGLGGKDPTGVREKLVEAINEFYSDVGVDSERKRVYLDQSLLKTASEWRDKLTTEEQKEKMLGEFSAFSKSMEKRLEELRGRKFGVTAESDPIEKEYAKFYKEVSNWENRLGRLKEVSKLRAEVLQSEFMSRARALLDGQSNQERGNVEASKYENWNLFVADPRLISEMENAIIEIGQIGQNFVDFERLEEIYSLVLENFERRQQLHYSWVISSSKLQGDGGALLPPSGLTPDNFIYTGETFSYFIKGNRENGGLNIPELGHWVFNPVLGKKEALIINPMDESDESFLSFTYNQTLLDYLTGLLDNVYQGKEEDAVTPTGEQINNGNLATTRQHLIAFLLKKSKQKIKEAYGALSSKDNDSLTDVEKQAIHSLRTIVDGLQSGDKDFEDNLKTQCILAYRNHLIGTHNHTFLAHGSVMGQSAKTYYDAHPQYATSYALDATGSWNILQFANLWSMGDIDPLEIYYSGIKHKGKMVKVDNELLNVRVGWENLRLLDSNAPTAKERFETFGCPTYEWLLQPMIKLNNIERSFVLDENGNFIRDERGRKLRRKRYVVTPNPLRFKPLRVKKEPLKRGQLEFTARMGEDTVLLRKGVDPQNCESDMVEGVNTNRLLTLDDLQDARTGDRLYGLMPLEILGGDYINFYNGWNNNVRDFMDKFIFASPENFSSNVSLEDLNERKKKGKYITDYQPKVGPESVGKTKFKTKRNGGIEWDVDFAELLKNRLIVKIVLTKAIIDYTVLKKMNRQELGSYLNRAQISGVLGPDKVGLEVREAIFVIVTTGSAETGRRLLSTLHKELEKYAQYH